MPLLSFFYTLFSFGFSMSSIQVRPATLRDAKAIAQIHTVSAQEAYKGLVPDEQLKAMSSVEKRQAYWREAIEYCEPQVQVAVDGEKIVGFVGYDRSRDEKSRPTTGEIWAIYAAPTHWNQGVGLALWDAALSLGPPRMLVTSAVPMMAGGTGNLYLSGKTALLAENRLVENAPNGLGDLIAALFLSRLLDGMEEERALQLATASVFEILARTAKVGGDELALETHASSLSTPMAMVQMRKLFHPAQKRRT